MFIQTESAFLFRSSAGNFRRHVNLNFHIRISPSG